MRRIGLGLVVAGIICHAFLLGCSGQAPGPGGDPVIKVDPPTGKQGEKDDKSLLALQPPEFDEKHARYESSLLDALNLLGDKKFADALIAFETARSFKDTDYLRAEIDKLKTRIDQLAAAERAVQDIQTVLTDGKAVQAAQLATVALQQYGGGDTADDLAKLKLQADAITAADLTDNAARHKRFREDGEAALKDKNLRAAALALEQALQFGDDAQVRKDFDAVTARLTKYDENRRKAAELRRDPINLEDALALLKEAEDAWDTLQIRQEIDEYSLALQNRRDRASVADFEVRGEIGIPDAGRMLADELLPHLKSRFDLLERVHLGQVLQELKLDAAQVADDGVQQRELGRLAKLRYLVVGSITRVGGIAVNARLVDVRTGLIVQTAKIVAGTPEELMPLLPELAKLLFMSDEQRIEREQELAKLAKAPPPPPAADAPLPPVPEPPAAEQPLPPPEVIEDAPAPALGGLGVDDFAKLPDPPPDGQPLPQPEVGGDELVVKRRLLHVSLHLGDNLFRRGRFRDALRHYEFALSLAPDNFDVRLRLERCRPHLPPPVIVLPSRPRIAVIDFVVKGHPSVVPPGLGSWTPQHLAPYFHPHFDVVDRGEVYWYMGRLGMTMRDLMFDAHARRWLGRALNVRYFVLGTIHQTASFDVNTYLVDAEHGWRHGHGRVHVRNRYELKLRLGELTHMTRLRPAEVPVYVQQTPVFQGLLGKAQVSVGKGNFQVAIGFFQDALRLRPGNVEVQVLLQRTNRLAQQAAVEEARRRENLRIQAQTEQYRRGQLELAHAAEAARLFASQQTADQRRILEEKRLRDQALAHTQLVSQARLAVKAGNLRLSIQLFDSALNLRRSDEVYRELALARAAADKETQLRSAAEHAQREALLRQQRERELAQAQKQLEEERLRRLAQEAAERKAQDAAYQQHLDHGQRLLAKESYNAAIVALQAARRVKKTDAVEALLSQALVGQAKFLAQAKGEQARKDLERQLADEKLRREKAEAQAKRDQDLYNGALGLADKAMRAKQYDLAITKYHEAGKIHRSDAVLSGIRQAETARDQASAAAAAVKQKQLDEQQRIANLQRWIKEGEAALAAKDFDKAVKAFRAAKKLAPGDVDALTGLSKAEQAHKQHLADTRRLAEEQERDKTFRQLLDSGEANIKSKQYDVAVAALTEALRLKPGHKKATELRDSAVRARDAATTNAKTAAEAKKKAEAYQKVMNEGRLALNNRQYDAAIQAFQQAQKLLPGDQSSASFLKDAQKAKSDVAADVAAQAKKRAEELKRAEQLKKALSDGRAALAAGNFKAAADALGTANKLAPQDPDVQRSLQDLRRAEDNARVEAVARQKRLEQYQALMKTGQTALAAKRFDEAVKAFTDATQLMPGEKTSQELLRQAQKLHNAAKSAAELELKQKQAEKERVGKFLATGQAALKKNNLDAAAQAFAEAQKMAPNDPAVKNALQDLDQARRQADAARKTAERVAQLVKEAQKALKAGQLDSADKALTEARKLAPQDPAVLRAQQDLDQARRSAAADAEKMKRQAAYQDALKQGEQAFKAKRFDEAIKAYGAALKLMPGDQTATRALQEANQARDASKKTPPTPKAKEDYNQQMKSAAALEKKQKYADAVKAYEEALKLFPKDAKASDGKRYANHMADGHQHLGAKRFKDAVREFEAALQARPNDQPAMSALKKAKAGK